MQRFFAIALTSIFAACHAPSANGPSSEPAPAADQALAQALPQDLADLVRFYSDQTGHNLTYNSKTEALLESIVIRPVGPPGATVLLLEPKPPSSAAASTESVELVLLKALPAADILRVLNERGPADQVLADSRRNALILRQEGEKLTRLKDRNALLDGEQGAR